MSTNVRRILPGTEGTADDDVECITGIEYFADEQNYPSNQPPRSEFNQPVTDNEEYVHPMSSVNQYQPFYTERTDLTPIPSSNAESSHVSIPSQAGYEHRQPQISTGDILGLPSDDPDHFNGEGARSNELIRESPGQSSQGGNEVMETHSCQLCKRKFCDPTNLLKHMKEFHHVDTAHVVGRRREIALRQGKIGAGRWQVAKLAASSNPAYATAPENKSPRTLISCNFPVASVGFHPTAISTNSTAHTVHHIPISVVPFRNDVQSLEVSVNPSYRSIAPKGHRLTASQIKAAGDLIVADMQSFYCSKCYVRFTTRSLGEKHARTVHFGEILLFCLDCKTEYYSEENHSKVCSAVQRTSVFTDNSSSTMPLSYTLNAVNFSSGQASNLVQRPNISKELPHSSSEISSTSSEIFMPEGRTILPSTSNSPNCEVINQPIKGKSPVEIIPSQLENSSRSVEKYEASDFERFISSNGVLTEEQKTFSMKMARKVTVEKGSAKFQCKICNVMFTTIRHCREHVQHVHLKRGYQCGVCELNFGTRKACYEHRNSHGNDAATNDNVHGTHITEPVGIHPTFIPAYIETYIEKKNSKSWVCRKCNKILTAHRHAVNHVRQVHFGKCHQCNSCGLYFEQGLEAHRKKCYSSSQSVSHHSGQSDNSSRVVLGQTPRSQTTAVRLDQTATEVTHLTDMMRNSIKIWAVTNVNQESITVFKCLLCSASFDKKINAESHLWIEHIRNEWIKKCGTSNVDDIYLQFLQAQFVTPNSQSDNSTSMVQNVVSDLNSSDHLTSPSQHTGEINNPLMDENCMEDAFFNENDDEMLFDPSSVSGTSIFVEESTATGKHVTEVSNGYSDLINASLQCKVEIGDETVEYDNNSRSDSNMHDIMTDDNETFSEKSSCVVVSKTVTAKNPADSTSFDTVPAASATNINYVETSLPAKYGVTKASLSPSEIKQLELKSLQFIKEKQGQFVCIVCQRVSKLRRNLVEHVRRVHLCRELEANDIAPSMPEQRTPGTLTTGKDYYEEIVGSAVKKFLGNEQEPSKWPIHPLVTVKPSSGKRTLQDRNSRFIRPDGYEYFCTVCKIRSTKSERLIHHISSVHFGETSSKEPSKQNEGTEEVLRCPGCKKVMASKSFKARHMPRCSLAKRLFNRRLPSRHVESATKHLQANSSYTGNVIDSNFQVDTEGNVRRNAGRPFRNPAPITGPRGEKYVVDPTGKPVPVNTVLTENLDRAVKPAESMEVVVTNTDRDDSLDKEKQCNISSVVQASATHSMAEAFKVAKVNAKPIDPKQQKRSTNIASISKSTPGQSVKNTTHDKSGSLKASNKHSSVGAIIFKQEDVKKLIIPWSIGGKYSFSKCKECSVLFNKYENAEAHVRSVHLATQTNITDETLSSAEGDKTSQDSVRPSPLTKPPPRQETFEEENSPGLTTPSNSKNGIRKKRRRIIVESDSEQDEGGVFDNFSPTEYSNGEEEALADDPKITNKTIENSSVPAKSNTQAQVLNKFRPFSAFPAGDALKKYMQPKRVSKALTSLTSKEFSDAQKFIVKIEKCGYECRGCGSKFPRLNAISRHVRLKHFVERPYHCPLCDERFFHLNEFETHKLDCTTSKASENISHEKPKLLAQSWSDNSTTTKSRDVTPEDSPVDVTETFENKDPKSFVEGLSKKRHRCRICKLTFAGGYTSCFKHIRKIHFGEKPYNCVKCNEAFRYNKTYVNHVLVCGTGSVGTAKTPDAKEPTPSKETIVKPTSDNKSEIVDDSISDEHTFRCKLCNEVSSDKPLFRYHLVSVHYEELSKGRASSFFDMIEDIIDTLAIKVQPKKSSVASQVPKKQKATAKLNCSKKSDNPDPNKDNTSSDAAKDVEVKTPEPEVEEFEHAADNVILENITDQLGSYEPVVVHKDEKQLLASLPTVESFCGTPVKKITVRLKPLSCKGILPECLINAAKNLCGKLDVGTFQCKNCGRCFGTYQGVLGHVRIQHFGELRYQCDLCHKFLADGFKNHRERCMRKNYTTTSISGIGEESWIPSLRRKFSS